MGMLEGERRRKSVCILGIEKGRGRVGKRGELEGKFTLIMYIELTCVVWEMELINLCEFFFSLSLSLSVSLYVHR